jgi:hypothetical protein
VSTPPNELGSAMSLVRRALGVRSGPHLLHDARCARAYRLIEAALYLLVAAKEAELGHGPSLRARLKPVMDSVQKTLDEVAE